MKQTFEKCKCKIFFLHLKMRIIIIIIYFDRLVFYCESKLIFFFRLFREDFWKLFLAQHCSLYSISRDRERYQKKKKIIAFTFSINFNRLVFYYFSFFLLANVLNEWMNEWMQSIHFFLFFFFWFRFLLLALWSIWNFLFVYERKEKFI